MARFSIDPDLSSVMAFEDVSLTMPRADRRSGQGRRHRLRRLAGETKTRQVQVLDGISFEVRPGEAVAVLADDGEGCEEVLRLAAGTLMADGGTVRRRTRVVPMLDDSRCLDASYTVRQNIYVVGALLGMSPEEVAANLGWITRMADTGKWMDAYLSAAPKNLRQRIVWTTSMATRAEAFAIEESIVVGKDEVADRCWRHVEELRDAGVAFLVTSGDAQALERFCTRAIVLRDGRVIADTSIGAALEMVSLHTHRHVHLEAPPDDDDEIGPVV